MAEVGVCPDCGRTAHELTGVACEGRTPRLLPPLTKRESEAAHRWFAGDETAWPVVEESVKRRVRLAALRLEAAQAQAALARVEALCVRWDQVTRGESPTTRAIREAVRGGES